MEPIDGLDRERVHLDPSRRSRSRRSRAGHPSPIASTASAMTWGSGRSRGGRGCVRPRSPTTSGAKPRHRRRAPDPAAAHLATRPTCPRRSPYATTARSWQCHTPARQRPTPPSRPHAPARVPRLWRRHVRQSVRSGNPAARARRPRRYPTPSPCPCRATGTHVPILDPLSLAGYPALGTAPAPRARYTTKTGPAVAGGPRRFRPGARARPALQVDHQPPKRRRCAPASSSRLRPNRPSVPGAGTSVPPPPKMATWEIAP